MKDELGDRMKGYESQSSYRVPKRTYTIIRLDGKGFSKWTKKLNKPFDEGFAEDMVETAKYLCANLQGVVFAYYQSDEISLLLTDFENNEKQQLYDGKIQKITSISASMATAYFNKLRLTRALKNGNLGFVDRVEDYLNTSVAMFDSRVFTVPNPDDVMNVFHWRQKDASRNSISMACHKYLGHKKTMGKNSGEKQEMLFQEAGINWNDYPVIFKRGVVIRKVQIEKNGAMRNRWQEDNETPIFVKNWDYLADLIPQYNANLFKTEEEREEWAEFNKD